MCSRRRRRRRSQPRRRAQWDASLRRRRDGRQSGGRTKTEARDPRLLPGKDGAAAAAQKRAWKEDTPAETGESKQTQELLKCLVKMSVRHEQELMRIRPDVGFIAFCDT